MNVNKGVKISILGMGWVGFPLGEILIKEGYQVQGSTTRAEKKASIDELGGEGFVLTLGDEVKGEGLDDFFACDVLVLTVPPSAISPGGRRSRAEPDGRFQAVIASVLERLSPTCKVLYTSSTSVYGDAQGEVSESTAIQPVTTSAKMVVQAETLVQARGDGLNTVVRLGGLVGKQRNPVRYLAGRKALKNPESYVNMIHLEDVVATLFRIVEQGIWGEVYNLVADQHPSRMDYYTHRARQMDLEEPTFMAGGGGKGKIVSNEKIRTHLGITLVYPDPLQFPI